jgi:hypothetical protein
MTLPCLFKSRVGEKSAEGSIALLFFSNQRQ